MMITIALPFALFAAFEVLGNTGGVEYCPPGTASTASTASTATPATCPSKTVGSNAVDISVSAHALVYLGEDLKISYTVDADDPNDTFSSVSIEILNADGASVAKWEGLSGSDGAHPDAVTWVKAKWQGTAPQPYANPATGPYTIEATGYRAGDERTDQTEVDTRFKVEFQVDESAPAGETPTRVAGLSDLGSNLRVLIIKGSATIVADDSDLSITDNGSSSPTAFTKKVVAENSQMQAMTNGTWSVFVDRCRDDIGNFVDGDNSQSGIQPLGLFSIKVK